MVKSIAIAESCTGGLISHLLTNQPGSSTYFRLGVVAYSNQTKISLLKVSAQVLEEAGSVSKEVALSMARGVRRLGKADVGLGITGIAGPSLPQEKVSKQGRYKVGLVFIALSSEKGEVCREFQFKGKREEIKEKAAREAIRLLRECGCLLPSS